MVKVAIDIGTNTLLMLIQTELNEYINVHRIARMGEKLHSTGFISEQAVDRACKILDEYYELLHDFGTYSLCVVGTAALRNASNSKSITDKLTQHIHAPIEIISGDEEAMYTFLGTIENEELSVVIDVGGGSTEIVLGTKKSGIEWRNSFPLGAVTFTEQFHDKENKSTLVQEKVFNELRTIPIEIQKTIVSAKYVYANAGTPTTIAAVAQKLETYDESKVQNYEIEYDALSKFEQLFHSMTVDELRSIVGVHPDRADILPAGTSILKSIFEFFPLKSCLVSTKGLRYGVIHSIKN
jgi:exopolyphosphatase/guanosine-5'-triphosphate,3'-diphosphate pyrophosphatase